ncbi:MAG: cohesin domain-containing protein [Chloroflexota bacterium]
MIRRNRFPGLITVLVLVFASPSQPIFAQDGKALVRTDPAVLEVGKGQIETLQVLLVDAQNVYGIDLQAAFDPAVVEVVDADSEQDGIQMTPGPFIKPDFVLFNTADNEAGTLHYVVTQLNPTPPANGEGVILSIQFLGKAVGIETALTILSVQIADRRGVKPPVTAQDADLVAVPPKPPTSTPAPTSTLMLSTPTSFVPTVTRSRSQPTARPTESAEQNHPTNAAEVNSVSSDRILTCVTVAGFFGSALLIGLSFWLLASKRRKERIERPE